MKFIFSEAPISLHPELAAELGMEEAAILQQICYWVSKKELSGDGEHEGKFWVYNTYSEWQESSFFFLSERKIADSIRRLETLELIISKQINKPYGDCRKHYTTNDENLKKLESVIEEKYKERLKKIREQKQNRKNFTPPSSKTESPSFKNGTTPSSETERPNSYNSNSYNSSDILVKSPENLKLIEKNDKEDSTEKLKDKIGREMILCFGLTKSDLTNFFDFVKNYDMKFIDWFIEQLKDPKQHKLLLINDKRKFFLSELKKDSYGKTWAEKLEADRKNHEYENRKKAEKQAQKEYENNLKELDKQPVMIELKNFLKEQKINKIELPGVAIKIDAYLYYAGFISEGLDKVKSKIMKEQDLKKDCA